MCDYMCVSSGICVHDAIVWMLLGVLVNVWRLLVDICFNICLCVP